ncbi:hypothetical protein JOL79_17775 [Microbispora sp. RL4-1S]|uniref:Uncharacterized protein n=1 Tax=Microbispora oryzae TaxID=2806554 RepID=A0A940WRC7_9ACTN|nr:hypothetical protein [Microbispora oryzae]MBP2705666.1 hypothetical protein [Microbispora oryzae]
MEGMVCDACAEDRHDECPGGNWCDCQHRRRDGEPESEPPENWVRQG